MAAAEEGSRRAPATELVPLRGALTEGVRAPLYVLMGAAAMVFLLGCLNLGGVAVSRFLRRAGEIRVRRMLGAGRARMMRQVVIEALLLAALSGAAGLLFAVFGVRLLLAWLPADVPGLADAGLGATSALLAAALATLAALLINALPALPLLRERRIDGAARTATQDRGQARVRSGLAVAQVTVALLLVVAAGLLGSSLLGLARTPLGVDLESVLTFEVDIPQPVLGEQQGEEEYLAGIRSRRDLYVEQVLARLSGLPGVGGVGAVSQLPLSKGGAGTLRIRRRDAPDDDSVTMRSFHATPGYFDAIGIPIIRGSSFTDTATTTGRAEIILSRSAAETLFGSVSAVAGEAVFRYSGEWIPAPIVGVVEDIRFRGPETEPGAALYVRVRDLYDSRLGFAVRVAGDPGRVAQRIEASVAEIDPAVPPFGVQTSRQALSRELAARQALAAVSGLFALTAVLLAAIGIYGLIAEGVARRRREIGIRVALGAPIGAIVRSVAGRGIGLATLGTLIALPLAWTGGRLLDRVLFNVSPTEPAVLVAAPALLLAVAALAAWLPARTAAQVDPVEVLSSE